MKYNNGIVIKKGGSSVADPQQHLACVHQLAKWYDKVDQKGITLGIFSGKGKLPGSQEKKLTDLAYQVILAKDTSTREKSFNEMYNRLEADLVGLKPEAKKRVQALHQEAKKLVYNGDIPKNKWATITGLPERSKARIIYELGSEMLPLLPWTILDYNMGIISEGNGYIDQDINSPATIKNIENKARGLEGRLAVAPGFVAINQNQEMVTLGRGYSDDSATIHAAALFSDLVVIYSDQDGVKPVDPKIISGLPSISTLTYDEAEAFAGLGAKIISYTAIAPVKDTRIPVKVLNSFNLEHPGTEIRADLPPYTKNCGVKAIASVPGYTLVDVQGMSMNKPGVAANVESTFANHGISVECIADDASKRTYAILEIENLGPLIKELKDKGHYTDASSGYSRIALIGEWMQTYGNGQNADQIMMKTLSKMGVRKGLVSIARNPVMHSAYVRENLTRAVVKRLYTSLER